MKFLEKLALILFSIIMIVFAVTSCLVVFDIIELKTIYRLVEELLKDDIAKKVILGVSAVAILLAIKSLFFPSRTKKRQEIKSGVLLENKDGRLLISKDTIENLVNSVVKSFDQAVDVQTKINLDINNKITVYVSLLVKEESVIKDLSSSIQNKIKDTIKRSTDLDVSQVNINIKDIENNKNNGKINQAKNNQIKNNQLKNNEVKNHQNQVKVETESFEVNNNPTKENQEESNLN